jgi:hypothetical protein
MKRMVVVVAALVSVHASDSLGQVDTVRALPDSAPVSVSDTVRVWSAKLKVKGTRGVVSRVDADSLAFIAPAGFRKIPREYVGDMASIDRVDLLSGRHRSFGRVTGQAVLGGVLGAGVGALIGTGLGALLYEMNKEQYADNEGNWDNRGMYRFFGAIIFGTAGAAGGAIGGAIDGARSRETWRRVR